MALRLTMSFNAHLISIDNLILKLLYHGIPVCIVWQEINCGEWNQTLLKCQHKWCLSVFFISQYDEKTLIVIGEWICFAILQYIAN